MKPKLHVEIPLQLSEAAARSPCAARRHASAAGGDKRESGVARGLVDGCNTEKEEDSDIEMDGY
eukprot:1622855-Pleurochrysis_carterae.AAC.4